MLRRNKDAIHSINSNFTFFPLHCDHISYCGDFVVSLSDLS